MVFHSSENREYASRRKSDESRIRFIVHRSCTRHNLLTCARSGRSKCHVCDTCARSKRSTWFLASVVSNRIRRDPRFARVHVCTHIERVHSSFASVSREPAREKGALEARARAAQTMFIITVIRIVISATQFCPFLTLSASPLPARYFFLLRAIRIIGCGIMRITSTSEDADVIILTFLDKTLLDATTKGDIFFSFISGKSCVSQNNVSHFCN